jgi:hypothetical protein
LESSEHPLAKFMQGLQQSYSQYFNLKHRETGHLFEGRYKAIICQKDPYFLELVRYIHLNPVRAGHGEKNLSNIVSAGTMPTSTAKRLRLSIPSKRFRARAGRRRIGGLCKTG